MPNIQTLDSLLTKMGDMFYDDLLSSEITIYEKLDGNNFGFVVVGHNQYDYFKKNHNAPLGDVDRTLTKLYEDPINYFETLNPDIKEALPIGYKFGFFYFPNTEPNSISYDNLPTNNLILNYVEDESGNKISNVETLTYFSNLMGVSKPPIYYKGKLSGKQKTEILEYLHKPEGKRRGSLIKTILSIVTPNIKKTYLNDGLDKPIDSLIFKFDNGREINYAKLQDPTFINILKNRKDDSKASDNYYLILSDILDFFKTSNIEKIGLRKRKYEDRYIELICKLFNKFIEKKGSTYQDIDFELPNYLKKQYNNLNKSKIENLETLAYIEQSDNYKELFRIMLSSFRKRRYRNNTIFNKFMNSHFNQMVDSIIQKCSFGDNLSESFITYKEFEKIYIKGEDSKDVLGLDLDVYNQEHSQKIIGYKEPKFEVNNFLKTLYVEIEDDKFRSKNKEFINLIIDDFSPMLKSQLLMCRENFEDSGIRNYIIIVRSRKPAFPDSTLKKIFDNLSREESIKGYYIVDKPILSQIMSVIRDDYRVNKIYSTETYKRLLDVQVKTSMINNNHFDFRDPNDVLEYYNKDIFIVNKIDKYIEDDDFTNFREHVPEVYSHLYTEIVSNSEFKK